MRRNAIWLVFTLTVYCASAQLVLDDIADEFEETADNAAKKEPTDPYTKMLQWGVDNMDRASVAEQAKAVREVRHDFVKLLEFDPLRTGLTRRVV
jgi:hypothetical protein